jgi:hypothetical protein
MAWGNLRIPRSTTICVAHEWLPVCPGPALTWHECGTLSTQCPGPRFGMGLVRGVTADNAPVRYLPEIIGRRFPPERAGRYAVGHDQTRV